VTLRYASVVAALALAAAAAAWIGRGMVPAASLRGTVLGIALAASGAIAGMMLTAWSTGKEQKVFFAALAGGILGRLAVFGAALAYVGLRAPGAIDATATAVALLASYVVFQVLEVRLVLLRARSKEAR
jgi:hypothetical protein